jgi:hypothetical protein
MLTYWDVRDDLEENSLWLEELEEEAPGNSSLRLCFQPADRCHIGCVSFSTR